MNDDWNLVMEYYAGKNKPMAILILIKYHDRLFGLSYWILQDNGYPNDVLDDVCDALISLKISTRKRKFRPKRGNVFGALAIRVKHKSIDYYRKLKDRFELLSEPVEIPEDNSMLAKDEVDQARKVLTKDDNIMLNFILDEYENDALAETFKLSKNELRVAKQRIYRQLKREILRLRNDNNGRNEK